MLVQTRSETDLLVTHATRGAIERFYDDEIALREMLSYPPYSRFILLTWVGAVDAAKETSKKVKELLKSNDIQYYFNPNSTSKKTYGHALIRMKNKAQPDQAELLNRIRSLPPYIKVEVNPERIV